MKLAPLTLFIAVFATAASALTTRATKDEDFEERKAEYIAEGKLRQAALKNGVAASTLANSTVPSTLPTVHYKADLLPMPRSQFTERAGPDTYHCYNSGTVMSRDEIRPTIMMDDFCSNHQNDVLAIDDFIYDKYWLGNSQRWIKFYIEHIFGPFLCVS
ncbi:hypothetical protein C8J57DRAFT_1221675 [Mycena rebaudengoi]|nr:hypothetical protein C8J57DRAFT_1221675 [Mycena rebaudengoi]